MWVFQKNLKKSKPQQNVELWNITYIIFSRKILMFLKIIRFLHDFNNTFSSLGTISTKETEGGRSCSRGRGRRGGGRRWRGGRRGGWRVKWGNNHLMFSIDICNLSFGSLWPPLLDSEQREVGRSYRIAQSCMALQVEHSKSRFLLLLCWYVVH